MQFNSFIFICAFMPLMVITYFVGMRINSMTGKILLVVGSVLFYAYSDWSILIVLVISLIINFIFAKFIEISGKWSKLFLVIPTIINVALLLYFKYTNFIIENSNLWFGTEIALKEMAMPIGISFFTFQQIAYMVAIYKKQIGKVIFIDYVAFMLYFPKMLMGPLMDPVDFMNQINDERCKRIDWDNITYGIKIFSFGLFKKMLLADTFAAAVSWGYTNIETTTSMDWLFIMLFYTFEIYFDFSGYTDMAVGSSLMFNIVLPVNFDSPYKAVSIRDFWKRWHISLTQFFTKYIYIPLGGSKKGIYRTCENVMIVFLISGIWHGAGWTFILWGVLHGVLSLLDRMIDKSGMKPFEPFRWVATFGVINVLWLLFRSDSIEQWRKILETIVCFADTNVSDDLINIFSIPEVQFFNHVIPAIGSLSGMIRGFWMHAFVLSSSIICFVPDNNYRRMQTISNVTMLLAATAFVWGFISLSRESVFIYFGF